MADFGGENIEILQNAMALIANVPNSEKNSRNFPFGNTTNHKLLHKMGPKVKFHKSASHKLCY